MVVALIAVGAFLWRNQQAPVAKPEAPPQLAVAAPAAIELPASSVLESGIRHPIEVPVEAQRAATPPNLEAALVDLFGRKTVLSMFQTQDFARRFVATVDNLGRPHAPVTAWPVCRSSRRRFPGRYFNDRLVEVIDQLLATPDVSEPLKVHLPQINGPVQSERPWVLYEFDDPALQSLLSPQAACSGRPGLYCPSTSNRLRASTPSRSRVC